MQGSFYACLVVLCKRLNFETIKGIMQQAWWTNKCGYFTRLLTSQLKYKLSNSKYMAKLKT